MGIAGGLVSQFVNSRRQLLVVRNQISKLQLWLPLEALTPSTVEVWNSSTKREI